MSDRITIIDAINSPSLFRPWFEGSSWDRWRAVLRATYGLKLGKFDRKLFHEVAERDPPKERVREAWFVCGRRAGKDSVASVIAAYEAAFFQHGDRLRPGERALVLCIACDRDQARIVLGYIRAFFELPVLKPLIQRETRDGLELSNGVDIVVATNDFRSVRGRAILCAILDECAFYSDESSASPDQELYAAIEPGLMTLPNAMLIGISTAYRRAGLLYNKWKKHFGKDRDDVLVIRAPSILMNPTLDERAIERALAEDRAKASSELLSEWREDLQSYVAQEVVDAAIVPATRPPFSPEAVIAEYAKVLNAYGLNDVEGDRYSGAFCAEQFKKNGISYKASERTKSEIYDTFLPLLNSRRIELLDNKQLVTELTRLERRTARGGRSTTDHPVGGHDDTVNAAAGALVLASGVGSNDVDMDLYIRAYGGFQPTVQHRRFF
jgi:hypothetical protein